MGKKRELIFSERYNDASGPRVDRESNHRRFRNVVSVGKKKGKMVKKAMSTPSDTLPFKDHSATDRKGVSLDFMAPSPLPAPLLARGMLSARLTYRWTLLFRSFPFILFFSFLFFCVNLVSSFPRLVYHD